MVFTATLTFASYFNTRIIFGMNGHLRSGWKKEYQGPDMTDFGHRWLKDPEFSRSISRKEGILSAILEDDDLPKSMAI